MVEHPAAPECFHKHRHDIKHEAANDSTQNHGSRLRYPTEFERHGCGDEVIATKSSGSERSE